MNEGDEKIVWILAGAVAAVLAALWTTGALATAVLGGGWDPPAPAELPATAVRLLGHLGDPAAAWPAGHRRAVPGAPAFWFCGLLVAATMAAATLGLARVAAGLGLELPGGDGRRAR